MVVNRLGSKAHTGRFRALSFTIRSLHFRSRNCDQFPHRTYNTVFRFSVLSQLLSLQVVRHHLGKIELSGSSSRLHRDISL